MKVKIQNKIMKSDIFYITIYLSIIFFMYYGSFLYMVPVVQWMADEAEEKLRLVIEHHRNMSYNLSNNQTSFMDDLLDEYNGNI